MERSWLKKYDDGVAHDIDLNEFNSVPSCLDYAVQNFPTKPAVSCMGATFNYSQWGRLANHFAAFLQAELGIKKGDRIGIMLPNLIQFTVAFYGAQKVGAVCVSTNPLYTPREMQHQFSDSETETLIIADLFLDKLEKIIKDTKIKNIITVSLGDHLPFLKAKLITTVLKFKGLIPKHNLKTITYTEALNVGSRHTVKLANIGHSDLCVLQYTGGTTGVSKGAMLTHGNLLANRAQIRAWLKPSFEDGEETVLTALPLYHIFALSVNFLTLQSSGNHSILLPKPIPIENTVKAFKKNKITIMTGVNTLFNSLNNNAEFQKLKPRLKLTAGGGAAVQATVSKEWKKHTGAQIAEGYGLTEASPATHFNTLQKEGPAGSIGLPMPSTLAKIINENGEAVPIGETGELCIQGPQVMRGYYNRDEETKKTLVNGWLHTGDIAKRDADGYFYIVDRKKDMILVSGFNVFPNEIEAALAEHPKVLEAAVIGIPDPKTGETVKAFVVAKDSSLTVDELKAHCSEILTNYKRPKIYEFREDLPKSNIGKILRKELK